MGDFSDHEDNEDGLGLILKEGGREDLGDLSGMSHEEKLFKLHKGIMVVQITEEEVKVEEEVKEETPLHHKEEGLVTETGEKVEAGDKEEVKEKKETRKYFRTYFPVWKQKKIDKNRLFYETSIEVKTQTASKKSENLVQDDEENEDGEKQKFQAPV